MKRKMKKKLIAFMLCMVLVICNSVSILADTPAAATTTAENQVSETKTAKNEKSSEENKSTDDNDTSKQSEETDETKDEAPEATTTEKKEETTEATTEEKEDATTATTEAEEPTTEATTEDKATTEEADETSESDKKKETTTTEEEKTTAAEENTEAPTELTYENDDVKITVSANTANAIPEGASLQVVPILEDDIETAEQYKEVVKELQDKSEKEEYAIAGFLAYDITFINEDGNEIEPNGEVKVSMEYTKKTAPAELKDEDILADTNVTVMHLEEDENGQVKEVVDMAKNDQLKKVEASKNQQVQTAEFVTESFSAFTLVWTADYGGLGSRTQKIQVNYYSYDGKNYKELVVEEEKIPENVPLQNEQEVDLSKYEIEIDDYRHLKTVIGINETSSTEVTHAKASYIFGSFGSWEIEYLEKGKSVYSTWDNNNGTPQIYIIYEKTGGTTEPDPGDPETPQEPLGEPEHNKTIEKIAEDSYTLSLDVTGKQGDATPIDILLIVDKSNSMNSTRRSNVNNAITILKNQLKNSEIEADIQMAAVTFSGPNSTGRNDDSEQKSNNGDAWKYGDGWTRLDNFNFSLSNVNGGTNWQAGVRKGEEVLAQARDSSKKYVIFLTDGDPTFRYGNSSNTTVGTGSNDRYGNNYRAAVNEWNNNSPNLSAPTTIKYVVDATGSSTNKCDDFAEDIAATELAGGNWYELQTSFGKIADNITKPSYTNVSIHDTLSEYAEFASNPNLRVYKVENGQEKKLDEDKYTYSINKTAKTVQVNLLKGKELEDGVTYRIKFDIVPSEQAYTEYAQNKEENPNGTGYDDVVGDKNTDTNLEKITSSEKPGFHSNEKAYVSYRENGGSQLEAEYKHPVLQVDGEYVPENPDPEDPELSAPAHQKYIRDNGNGQYDLSLDVTGELGDADPIDILLIIDTSSSMKDNSRYKNVNLAINALLTELKTVDGDMQKKISLAAVTFNGDDDGGKENDASWPKQWTTLNTITVEENRNNFFMLQYPEDDRGTNWQAGIRTGEKAFSNRSSDNKKYVVFLTDGIPTFRYDDEGYTVGEGNEETYQWQWINGEWVYVPLNFTAAVTEWANSTNLNDPGTTRYVVDATGGNSSTCDDFAKEITGDDSAEALDGNNEETLKSSFRQIATNIVRPAYNSVSITDTLSAYVDFDKDTNETAETFANKVKVYAYHKQVTTDTEGNTSFNEPIETARLNPNQYTCSVDFETKTVTVNLTGVGEKGDSKLQDGMTYVVKFPVVTTEEAEYEYLLNGYGDVVGDANTDAPNNSSSSGQPGFHSNTLATVKYKVEDSEEQTETYDHPVVQVAPETVDKTVQKKWEGLPEDGTEIQVQLKAEVDLNGDGSIDMILNHDNYSSLPENMTVTLNANNAESDNSDIWTYTWNKLPKYYYYTDLTGTIQQCENPISYSIDEVRVPNGYDKTSTNEEDDITTITNTKQAFIEVSKQWNNGTLSLQEGETLSHGSVKVALYKDGELQPGTVTELSESNGYWHKYSIPYDSSQNYTIKEVVEKEDGTVVPVESNQYLMVTDILTKNGADEEIQNIYTPAYETVGANDDGNKEIVITNTLQLGSIEITKTDTDDNVLAGAKFKVTGPNGYEQKVTTEEKDVLVDDGSTATKKAAIAKLDNLLPGEYTITEIQSPEGYSLLANPVTVEVGMTSPQSDSDTGYEVVNDNNTHYYHLKLKVINNKLFTMPEAGGRNIFMMTLAGTAMIALAAGSTIYYRRRRGAHNKTRR